MRNIITALHSNNNLTLPKPYFMQWIYFCYVKILTSVPTEHTNVIKTALSVTIPGDPTTVRAEMVLLEMDRYAPVKLIKLFCNLFQFR